MVYILLVLRVIDLHLIGQEAVGNEVIVRLLLSLILDLLIKQLLGHLHR